MADQQPQATPAADPTPAPAPATAPAGDAPQEDYVDKALDAGEKAIGKKTGHDIDPSKYRSQNEKVTDKLRNLFQKLTGKKVPEKVSN